MNVTVRDLLDPSEWLKEWRGILVFLLVSALLAVGLWRSAVDASNQAEKLERVAVETHDALCTFTADLQRRYDDTRRYLRRHPGREPIPGITRADLRRSLAGQRSTLDTLTGLSCG